VDVSRSRSFEPGFHERTTELIGQSSEGHQRILAQVYSLTVATGSEESQLTKDLVKAGLGVKDVTIQIGDCNRWAELSMMPRVALLMRLTTTSLKYAHEHFSETTPRRRAFWVSRYRINTAMTDKRVKFESRLSRNPETMSSRFPE
jgi:hypothetical protein